MAQTSKQKIASEFNYKKYLVVGSLANIQHMSFSDDYTFKLQQKIVADLKKLAVAIEIERDKKLSEIK